jgi:amino acid permease
MKKFLVTSMIAIIVVVSSSFTTIHENSHEGLIQKTNNFKVFVIALSNTYPIDGTSCSITVTVAISFSWNGPGTPITNVNVGTPTFQVSCTGTASYAKQSEVTHTEFDNETAYNTDIDFANTGDEFLDGKLTDPDFLQRIMDDINHEIDGQKD